MSDSQPVRFLAHFTIDDADRYRQYEKGFFPILKAHGGRFITYDDHATMLEGDNLTGRMVLLEFDSEEALMTWWNSPEYREIAEHRHAGTTTHAVFFLHSPPER